MERDMLHSLAHGLAQWWSPKHQTFTDLNPEVREMDGKLAELLDKHDAATKAVADYARSRLEGK
jgi:hypothetical protein